MRHVSIRSHWRTASNIRNTPVASTSAVNSGASNDTCTWLCAARLYISVASPSLPLAVYSSSRQGRHNASGSSDAPPDERCVLYNPLTNGGWCRVRHILYPKEFGKKRTVLSGDTGNQCFLHLYIVLIVSLCFLLYFRLISSISSRGKVKIIIEHRFNCFFGLHIIRKTHSKCVFSIHCGARLSSVSL